MRFKYTWYVSRNHRLIESLNFKPELKIWISWYRIYIIWPYLWMVSLVKNILKPYLEYFRKQTFDLFYPKVRLEESTDVQLICIRLFQIACIMWIIFSLNTCTTGVIIFQYYRTLLFLTLYIPVLYTRYC